MSRTPYTGEELGATVTFDGTALPGWERIVIRETGKPQAQTHDDTVAESSAYEYNTDGMGGKGLARIAVTVTGKLKRTDYNDGSGILSFAQNTEAALVARKGTGAGKDQFTDTMRFLGLTDNHQHAGAWVTYEMRFESNGTGAWTASTS